MQGQNRDSWIGWWTGVPLCLGGLLLVVIGIVGFVELFDYRAAQVLKKDGVAYEVSQIGEYSRLRNSRSFSQLTKVEAPYTRKGQRRPAGRCGSGARGCLPAGGVAAVRARARTARSRSSRCSAT